MDKIRSYLRQEKEPLWTRSVVGLAIAIYILSLGPLWGNYGGIMILITMIDDQYITTPVILACVIMFLGILCIYPAYYLTILLWLKNRILAYVVAGMALVSYGLALIGGGIHLGLSAPDFMAIYMTPLIIVGVIFIGPGLGFIAAAYLEHKKAIDTGGIDLTEMDHQGVIHAQPGAFNQMNHNYYPTQTYV